MSTIKSALRYDRTSQWRSHGHGEGEKEERKEEGERKEGREWEGEFRDSTQFVEEEFVLEEEIRAQEEEEEEEVAEIYGHAGKNRSTTITSLPVPHALQLQSQPQPQHHQQQHHQQKHQQQQQQQQQRMYPSPAVVSLCLYASLNEGEEEDEVVVVEKRLAANKECATNLTVDTTNLCEKSMVNFYTPPSSPSATFHASDPVEIEASAESLLQLKSQPTVSPSVNASMVYGSPSEMGDNSSCSSLEEYSFV